MESRSQSWAPSTHILYQASLMPPTRSFASTPMVHMISYKSFALLPVEFSSWAPQCLVQCSANNSCTVNGSSIKTKRESKPAASLPTVHELNRVSTLLWTRLWLSEYYGWLDLLPRPLQLSPSQQMAGYLSCRLCVLWSSRFLQECLLCIHSLSIWLKRPSFQPVLTPDMPSSLSLIISHFWCRLRYKQFFSLEHLEVIVGH